MRVSSFSFNWTCYFSFRHLQFTTRIDIVVFASVNISTPVSLSVLNLYITSFGGDKQNSAVCSTVASFFHLQDFLIGC